MGSDIPRLNDLDTVPPPDGGDAYGNATVVRAAPSEILEAIRLAREKDAKGDVATGGQGEANVIVAAAEVDHLWDSLELDAPQDRLAPASAAKIPIPLDPAALKSARVPQDFENLLTQRPEESGAPVGFATPPEQAEPFAQAAPFAQAEQAAPFAQAEQAAPFAQAAMRLPASNSQSTTPTE